MPAEFTIEGKTKTMNPFSQQFINILYRIPVLLISLTVHELAHGFVSYRLGDPTAKMAGRLTLNPIKHLDPIGSLLLLTVGFGWAKAVPFDPKYYKNKRVGIMLTCFAGPLSNILLAIVFAVVFVFYGRTISWYSMTDFQYVIYRLLSEFLIPINIMLAALNLIPIPPLDGSKVLFPLLPGHFYFKYIMPYERYGMFVILVLSYLGILSIIMSPIVNVLYSIILNIINLIEGIL